VPHPVSRRHAGSLVGLLAALSFALASLASPLASAQDKVTFLTSWFAQAEHGGFYQAVATGLYKKHGLDVSIKMGGPQVNGLQLLTAGQTEFLMSYDFSVLKAIEQGLPVVTVGTSFQKDLQGLMSYEDVANLASLKGKTILVATAGRSSWWPWLKTKYNLTEEQTRPYTFNLQPFLADKNTVQQQGAKARFHLFADDGFPPYGTTIVTLQRLVKEKPDMVGRFVRASIEGWKSYFADPAPANAMIKKDNPNMTDEQIAYAIAKLKETKVLTGGDAEKMGIGIITDARWKRTYDTMVGNGLLKADVDFRQAYTTQFVRDLKVMP
jgi:NitT/TauT family transport system substrate-binding protein